MFLGRWQIDQHPEVGQFVAVGNLQKAADLPHDFRGIAGQLFISHLADWLPAREKGINSPLENLVPNQPSQLNSPLLEEMVAGLSSTRNGIRCCQGISPLDDEPRLRKKSKYLVTRASIAFTRISAGMSPVCPATGTRKLRRRLRWQSTPGKRANCASGYEAAEPPPCFSRDRQKACVLPRDADISLRFQFRTAVRWKEFAHIS